MKRTDIEVGTVYAFRRSKNYHAEQVMFLTGPNDARRFGHRSRSSATGSPYLEARPAGRRVNAGFPVVWMPRWGNTPSSFKHYERLNQEIISAALKAVTPTVAFDSTDASLYVVLNGKRDVCLITNERDTAQKRVESALGQADKCDWVCVELGILMTLGQVVGVYTEVMAADKAKRIAEEERRKAAEQAQEERLGRAEELIVQLKRLGFPSAHANISSRFGSIRIDLDEEDSNYLIHRLRPTFSSAGVCLDCKRSTFLLSDGTAVIDHREGCPNATH